MPKLRIWLALVLILAVGSGCSFSMGKLGLASTMPTAIKGKSLKKQVEGSDCAWHFLGVVPLGRVVPSIDAALGRALAKAPEANLLANMTTRSDSWTAILVGRSCLRVAGDAWKVQ